MRLVDYLKAIGIALGFITATQSPGLASTYMPSSIGGPDKDLQDNDRYLIRSGDNDHYLMRSNDNDRFLMRSSDNDHDRRPSFSENNSQKKFVDTAIMSSLLNESLPASDQKDVDPTAGVLSGGFGFDAGPESAGVSATPLPAALPLFAGGMGVLGFLVRRRKNSAKQTRQG